MSATVQKKAINLEWEDSLKTTTVKYHIAGAWVAVIFNLVFGATDYINVTHHFEEFFIFRLAVSTITAILLILRKPVGFSADFLIFIPFLFISIQNAFMWSLMDAVDLQKHTLAYIALFIGAGMLVLWRIYWSVIVVAISIAANIVFMMLNSTLPLKEILANGGLLTGTVMIFSIILIQTRYNLTKKEIISRLALKKSNKVLSEQKVIIESKNKDITASITYAKRIQDAILPAKDTIKKYLKHTMVFYKPRDIVSGDFYWFRHINGFSYLAAVDCTGHGVPGAFMSMIGNTLLNKLIPNYNTPAQILNEMKKEVINTLDQTGAGDQKDGMDVALCVIDHKKKTVQYAGAYNPLYLIRNGEMIVTKADRMPIGSFIAGFDRDFTNHTIELKRNDTIYIASDGFQDQFGKDDDKKYSSKQFKNFLLKIHEFDMEEQEALLDKELKEWKGDTDQLDDILVIGVKFK